MEIINKIIELLEIRGLEQKDLYTYLGVKAQTFSDWKAGRNKSYMKHITQIANFFNVNVAYLLGETDIKEKALPEQEEQKKMPYKLMELYNKLNSEGQDKLVSYADDLVTSGKYSNEQTFKIYRAAHSDSNKPAEIKRVGKEFAKTLEEAPETDEKF